ncbi:MAG TPA: rhodanese-like domain-containing protein [Candidatus Limnocylindrales bacterium]|nr:rhodanese-like domain-containing protein [Candidatus Limnocylindrales bacterium]
MSVRLADCRPRTSYDAGHLPGAVHLDPETQLSSPTDDPSVGGRHPLPDPYVLGTVFAAAGIGPDTFVLAYDDGSGWAARCWWLLRHLGHDAAGTFDIRAYEGPLELEEARVERAPFVPHVRDDDVIEADEILSRLGDPSLVLLDARAPERWRGDVEPLDPVAGRIPGARNAFFEEPLPPGAAEPDEIAVYCGSGVSAAPVVLRLVRAGRDDVRLYPGSFSEWCRDPSNPIERGDPT